MAEQRSKTPWDLLSIYDKASFIKEGVKVGLYGLAVKDFYNKNVLPKESEQPQEGESNFEVCSLFKKPSVTVIDKEYVAHDIKSIFKQNSTGLKNTYLDIIEPTINYLKSNKQPIQPNIAFLRLENNIFAEGGKIHINPSKKGTFTAAATKHGKSVQEFARLVLSNPENYSSTMVKKANFARNAAHWHDGESSDSNLHPFILLLSDLGYRYSNVNGKYVIPVVGQNNRRGYKLEFNPATNSFLTNMYGTPLYTLTQNNEGVYTVSPNNNQPTIDFIPTKEKAEKLKNTEPSKITEKFTAVENIRPIQNNLFIHNAAYGGFFAPIKKAFAKNYEGTFPEAFAAARNNGDSYFKWNGNRYSTLWETEKYRELHPEEYELPFTYKDALERIVREENTKIAKNGYIAELDAWQPHASVEKGAKTVSYGIKLDPHNQEVINELNRNKSKEYPNGYITNDFALLYIDRKLKEEYEPLAKKYWNNTFKDNSWEKLSSKMKSIILDYLYNLRGGIDTFPKLMKAIHDKDYNGIKENYKRYSNGVELGRNKGIKKELQMLYDGYYSIYK